MILMCDQSSQPCLNILKPIKSTVRLGPTQLCLDTRDPYEPEATDTGGNKPPTNNLQERLSSDGWQKSSDVLVKNERVAAAAAAMIPGAS